MREALGAASGWLAVGAPGWFLLGCRPVWFRPARRLFFKDRSTAAGRRFGSAWLLTVNMDIGPTAVLRRAITPSNLSTADAVIVFAAVLAVVRWFFCSLLLSLAALILDISAFAWMRGIPFNLDPGIGPGSHHSRLSPPPASPIARIPVSSRLFWCSWLERSVSFYDSRDEILRHAGFFCTCRGISNLSSMVGGNCEPEAPKAMNAAPYQARGTVGADVALCRRDHSTPSSLAVSGMSCPGPIAPAGEMRWAIR